jgi:hypothetical protein
METRNHLEPGEGWGEGGEDLGRLQRLLELVRREQPTELSPETRERIRTRVLEGWERYEAQRRRRRKLVVAASTVLVAGLVLMLAIRARAG